MRACGVNASCIISVCTSFDECLRILQPYDGSCSIFVLTFGRIPSLQLTVSCRDCLHCTLCTRPSNPATAFMRSRPRLLVAMHRGLRCLQHSGRFSRYSLACTMAQLCWAPPRLFALAQGPRLLFMPQSMCHGLLMPPAFLNDCCYPDVLCFCAALSIPCRPSEFSASHPAASHGPSR